MPMRPPAGFVSAFYDPLNNPNVPTTVVSTAGVASASVAFIPPSNVGGSAISSYSALSNPGGIVGTAASSPISVTGLSNGTSYTFRVWATNTFGPSAYSAVSNSATPFANPLWIAKLTTGAYAQAVVIDSDRNLYVVGAGSSGGFVSVLTKYNSAGVIQWQRQLADSGWAWGYGVALDSANNIYICGSGGASFGSADMIIIKYDNSGTVQWQRKLAGGSGQGDEAYSIALDTADNVYICGLVRDNFNDRDIFIAKYNSSGTLQWQRKLAGSFDIGWSIALDPSDNVYIGGQSNNAGNGEVFIAKYNSSGTIQFQKRIVVGGSFSSMIGYAIALDSSQNIYITGDIFGPGTSNTDDFYIAKLDSTASTIIWDRRLYSSGGADNGRSIAVDASGNVFVTGNSTQGTSGQAVCQIAKYNSSGTLQWQRMIERPSGSGSRGWGIKTDTVGNYYVVGDIDGNGFLIAKLSGDGTGTGTYTLAGTSVSYAATNMTDGGSTGRTPATSTLTPSTATMTGSTPSLTATTPTFVASVVTV